MFLILLQKTISLGGFKVCASKLESCNNSTDTRLATHLQAILCSPKEIANSSLTGKTANVHKNIDGVRDKDKLNPAKVLAIYGIIYSCHAC